MIFSSLISKDSFLVLFVYSFVKILLVFTTLVFQVFSILSVYSFF